MQQTVTLTQRDRKSPISGLTPSIAESADCSGERELALMNYLSITVPLKTHGSTNITVQKFDSTKQYSTKH